MIGCKEHKKNEQPNANVDVNNSSADEPTLKEKMRGLPWIPAGSPFHTFFLYMTVFGSIFVLFLDELKLDKVKIGFLLSLIPFCGMISLFVAPWGPKMGVKRMFLVFYYIRSIAPFFLLLTPLILGINSVAAFMWIAIIIFIVGICRAIAETGKYSWEQECIPDFVRGRVYAFCSIMAAVAGVIAVAISSFILKHGNGLGRFMILISIGALAGIISTSCHLFVPGGKPKPPKHTDAPHLEAILNVFKDKNFVVYLATLGLVMASTAFPAYFLPLFLKQKVGVPIDKIVLLEISTNIGLFISVFFWGWASDHYGSKPAMLVGLLSLMLIPVFWTIFPRHYTTESMFFAIIIVFFYGAVHGGWTIGSQRYLYTGAMPAEKKTAYTAVLYAWISLAGGLAPLLCGWLMDVTKGINKRFGSVIIDSYVVVFMLCFACLLMSLIMVYSFKADSSFTMIKFLKSLIRGEPLAVLTKWFRQKVLIIFTKATVN